MNKLVKGFTVLSAALLLDSCDKVNDPYPPNDNPDPVATGTLLGTLSDITVTNSAIAADEMAELKAEYIFTASTPAVAKIVFKWKDGTSDTLTATGSSASSVAFVNVPVEVEGVSPNGTLRFIYNCEVTETINGDGEIFIPAKPADQLQNVFIEDFTGQRCSNCPRAARVIYNTIEPAHPGRVFSMGVHAGSYAVPLAGDPCFENDYRTVPGNEMDVYFGVTAIGNPTGMLNRKSGAIGKVFFDVQWNQEVNTQLAVPAKVYVKTVTHYNADNRNVTITAGAGAYANETGDYRIAMYLTEDSIVGCQEDNQATPSTVTNYAHRHMLKDVVFSNWQGENWAIDPEGNVKRIKSYTYTLPATIVAEHAAIITILYDATTFEIRQVTESKVVE